VGQRFSSERLPIFIPRGDRAGRSPLQLMRDLLPQSGQIG
jgi:hypothetical protein